MKLVAADGMEYLLRGERVTAGRSPGNDIVLADVSISPEHMLFEERPEGYTVRDLNSAAGTSVNGTRIIGDQLIEAGDVISAGNLRFTVQAESAGGLPGYAPPAFADAAPAAYTPFASEPAAYNPSMSDVAPAAYTPFTTEPAAPASQGWPVVESPAPGAYGSGPAAYTPPPAQLPVAPQGYGGQGIYGAPYTGGATKERGLALILEIVGGLFGLLGLGWFYAGDVSRGLMFLIGNWVFLCFSIALAVVTFGLSVCVTLPVSLALIVVSAIMLNNYANEHTELFRP